MTEAPPFKREMFVCLLLGIIIGAVSTYAVDHSWLQVQPKPVVPTQNETLVPFPVCPTTKSLVSTTATIVIAPYGYSDWTPYWVRDPTAGVITLTVAKDFHRPIVAYSSYFGMYLTVNASVSVDVYDATGLLGSMHGAGGIPNGYTVQGGNLQYSSNAPSFKFGNPNGVPITIHYSIYAIGVVAYVAEDMAYGCATRWNGEGD